MDRRMSMKPTKPVPPLPPRPRPLVSAEELARQQGVKPITDISELYGDFWPEDETCDEFLEWLYESRKAGGTARDLDDPCP